MIETIQRLCEGIEESYNCTILFAVESGSRLWGFNSPDSDYDVRFVFVYNDQRKYLDFFPYNDVIEHTNKEYNIDMVGFDIRKYLSLLIKSNPNVVDWTLSDIIYYGTYKSRIDLQEFIRENFNPHTIVQAYRGISHNALKDIHLGHKTIKKHLYALRGFLAGDWIIEKNILPPINFNELVEQTEMNKSLRREIKQLLELKREVIEDFPFGKFPQISAYLKASDELVTSGNKKNLPDDKGYTLESHNFLYTLMHKLMEITWYGE